jgi:DNA-binding transcriptional ArsR family regulator
MSSTAKFAEVAALAGDPARAVMLNALMDGRALTAGELARAAGITPQTASGHLSRLTTGGLLASSAQGRHRYYRLATPAVAQMIEGIMQIAASPTKPARRIITGPRDVSLQTARICYDHIAGRLGVAIADSLVAAGHVELSYDAGVLTDTGVAFLAKVGIDVDGLRPGSDGARKGPVLCKPCLDWRERRLHLAGRHECRCKRSEERVCWRRL